jgi:hypothetical protein
MMLVSYACHFLCSGQFSNSDANMMMMMGRGGMQGDGQQANMSMMINQGGGPMGNRIQPRMMAPTNMMGGPGCQTHSNPGRHPQMRYGQQGQSMKPQMHPMQPLQQQQQQQQPWGGYGSGPMAGASLQSMGYPAPPNGAPQQNQYMGNNSVVGGNPAVVHSGATNMANTVVGLQGTPFALTRQNYQARPTMRSPPKGSGGQMGAGVNVPHESMGTPGQFTSMGGGVGISGGGPPQQQLEYE